MDSIDVDPDTHSEGEINLSNNNRITSGRNYACAQCFAISTPVHFLPNLIISTPLSHNRQQKEIKSMACFLRDTWSQLQHLLKPWLLCHSSEESTVSSLLHTWAHTRLRMFSVSLIDKREKWRHLSQRIQISSYPHIISCIAYQPSPVLLSAASVTSLCFVKHFKVHFYFGFSFVDTSALCV